MPLYSIVKLAVFQRENRHFLRWEPKYFAAKHFAEGLRLLAAQGNSGIEAMPRYSSTSVATSGHSINRDEIQLPR